MSILRVYDPSECDEQGVPLDWERCRGLDELDGGMGSLHETLRQNDLTCPACDGHESLREATRFALAKRVAAPGHAACGGTGRLVTPWPQADGSGDVGDQCHCIRLELRCESCSHPMSEGTWEGGGPPNPTHMEHTVPLMLGVDREPEFLNEDGSTFRPVHYSPCDEGCRHLGPRRATYRTGQAPSTFSASTVPTAEMIVNAGPSAQIEASWRQVDIRCLGWPHDLRPEKLAVLCLRCFAERLSADGD